MKNSIAVTENFIDIKKSPTYIVRKGLFKRHYIVNWMSGTLSIYNIYIHGFL
jgi:hypothetical protein